MSLHSSIAVSPHVTTITTKVTKRLICRSGPGAPEEAYCMMSDVTTNIFTSILSFEQAALIQYH